MRFPSKIIISLSWAQLCASVPAQTDSFTTSTPVGKLGANIYSTPVNQLLTPAGRQLELPGMRPQALALSPNGRLLAVSGKTRQMLILDPALGEVTQRIALPAAPENEKLEPSSTHILKP